MRWRPTVVVATYNAPRELELVLTGLQRQSVAPLEILVADDGSTGTTRQTVDRWRLRTSVPLRHYWQEDAGFRKARIANEAVRHARGDYLVFLDGDTIPHRKWLADHLFHARPHRVLCGRRARLGPELTGALTAEAVAAGGLERLFGPVWRSALRRDTRRLARARRLPSWFSCLLRIRARSLMGCNFSLPRAAFVAVNGFDEDFIDVVGEDTDLGHRLAAQRYALTPLLNRGCVYHLHHEQRPCCAESRRVIAEGREQRRTRCVRGLERPRPSHRAAPGVTGGPQRGR